MTGGYLTDRITKTSDNIVFFSCYCTSGFAKRFYNCFFIQWFNSMNVYYFNTYSFFLQYSSGLYSIPYQVAACKNGNISSFTKELCFANFKIRCSGKYRPYRTTKS